MNGLKVEEATETDEINVRANNIKTKMKCLPIGYGT